MNGFEIAKLRPPTENFSLAILTHFNCPWSKCAFCPSNLFYKLRRFKRRTLEEIKKDIDNTAIINEYIWEKGIISQETLLKSVSEYPMLRECFIHMACWHLYSNATTAFLGGTNPLLYHSDFLEEILIYLRDKFPTITRITSYGRTITASKKNSRYFKQLYESGLDRIHVGMESGSDNVLKFVNKGVTSEKHILGGQKIKDGEISLCTYIMPGLGGRAWTLEHAMETARVINEIEPDFVRLRTLEIFPHTPLYKKWKAGEFTELTEQEVIEEEKILVENIECKTTITSDSAANLLTEIWGMLPKDKKKILRAIDNYLSLNYEEKLKFSLDRRLEAYNNQYGGLSPPIEKKLKRLSKISEDSKNYYEEMKKLIKYIRSRLIP